MTSPAVHLGPPPAPPVAAVARAVSVIRTFSLACQQIGASMRPATERVEREFAAFIERAVARANDPVRLAGIEGRLYVRAALDPAYATPEGVDALVRAVLSGAVPGVTFVTSANRYVLAAAVMRGWVTHRPDAATTWAREFGSTSVRVRIHPSA